MSCELPAPFTLLRTEHGNVIARDNRDNQEFVCLQNVIPNHRHRSTDSGCRHPVYREKKRMNKNTATHRRPGPGTLAFPRCPQPDTVFSGESPCCHHPLSLNTRTLSLLSQDRHSPLHSGGSWPLQQMADTCRDTVVLLEKNLTRVMRLKNTCRYPENADEKKKNTPEPCRMRSGPWHRSPACRPGDWP